MRADFDERPDQRLAPMNATPTAGLTYKLHHSRFGRATVKVLRVDDEWADCKILRGTLHGLSLGSVWGPGATKNLRIDHGSWVLLTPAQRVRYEKELKRLDKILKPMMDEIERSSRLGAEDYGITINAR